ncbi:MAG: type II toxin-antitoxin system RelE/ParE family toxin [Bacteroidota bacterium]|nr:type II toxin-antitoxin system RelE/ParE family toxin [Bacteroidota bacterium]
MVKIIWTDSAIEDLNDIGDYIAKDSERFAEITVQRLFNNVDVLEDNPKLGKMVPEFENDSIRELIRGSFKIVYQIIDDFRIDILTVHNCARLLGNTYDFSDFEDDK